MISGLRGKVISLSPDSIVLDVSGFCVEVFATGSLMSRAVVGEELFCLAYLQISDAGLALFGFLTERERALFNELLKVKTVGGKLAITILNHLDADQALHAIASGSPALLAVPGLGAKRAERICFELKNKIAKKFGDAAQSGAASPCASLDSFVIDALIGLGFSQSEAAKAISASKLNAAPDAEWSEESLLKASLGLLQRR